jgi:hypothetical protein
MTALKAFFEQANHKSGYKIALAVLGATLAIGAAASPMTDGQTAAMSDEALRVETNSALDRADTAVDRISDFVKHDAVTSLPKQRPERISRAVAKAERLLTDTGAVALAERLGTLYAKTDSLSYIDLQIKGEELAAVAEALNEYAGDLKAGHTASSQDSFQRLENALDDYEHSRHLGNEDAENADPGPDAVQEAGQKVRSVSMVVDLLTGQRI